MQFAFENWHDEINDDLAFTKYILGVVLSACRDFEERLQIIFSKKTANKFVKEVFSVKLDKTTKSDIMKMCPNLSRFDVRRH